tara:strand:+ start:296 stop:715 length:420 start_codon:yes stop_codon:yes gene_type:complete
MTEEEKIHRQMAAVLHEAGWIIKEPVDLLIARPWCEESEIGARSRDWEGTSSTAAYAGQTPMARPRPKARHYTWWARLFGGKIRHKMSGKADSMKEAMDAADEALLLLLRDARELRLRVARERTEEPSTKGALWLPRDE